MKQRWSTLVLCAVVATLPRPDHAGAGAASPLLTTSPADVATDDRNAASARGGQARIIEEMSIGVDVGADEYMFGEVLFVAAGRDGAVFVADRQVVAVRMYDPEGRFIKNVGREGEGPGEFVEVNGLTLLPDGSLAVWDLRTRRVSLFDETGTYMRDFRADGTRGGADSLHDDVDGNVYVRATDPEGVDWRSTRLLQFSPQGEPLGEVRMPDAESVSEETFVMMHPAGDLTPFSVTTLHAWSPLGALVVGRNDVYDIEVRGPAEPVHLSRNLEPVRVGAAEQAEWEAFPEFLNDRSRRFGLRVRDYDPIPDTKPYFRAIHTGDHGRIWVLRHVAAVKGASSAHHGDPNRPPLTWVEPTTFDVFEPTGEFVGSVVLPPNTRALAFRGDLVWGVHTDDNGVERVVRLRAEWPAPTGKPGLSPRHRADRQLESADAAMNTVASQAAPFPHGRYLGQVDVPDGVEPDASRFSVDDRRGVALVEDAAGVARVERYRLVPPGEE